MKLPLTIALVPLLWLTACQPRIQEIAPFSPPLSQTVLTPLSAPAVQILTVEDRIFVLTEAGTLLEHPDGKTRLSLGHPVRTSFILSPERLVVQTDVSTVLLFITADEAGLQPLPLAPDIRLLGAVGSGLVYSQAQGTHWLNLTDLQSTPLPFTAEDYLGIQEMADHTIYLIGRREILISRENQPLFQEKIGLTVPVSLHPAIINHRLWAMDSEHNLLCQQLVPARLLWKKRLDHDLIQPVKEHGRLIMTLTRSATMLALHANGSQAWYVSLGGPPLCQPVSIGRRIAIVARIREAAHLLIYDQDGRLMNDEILDSLPGAPVVFHQEALIYTARSSDLLDQLVSASTRFDVTAPLKSEEQIHLGRRIPFELTSVNLIKPEHRLSIVDENQKIVWESRIGAGSQLPPVWTADHIGSFRLLIETTSRSHPPIKQEIPFTVFDLQEKIRRIRALFINELIKKSAKKKDDHNPAH